MTVSNKVLQAAREWVKRVLKWAATITLILVLAGVTYFLIVLYDDEPVTYAAVEEHFKYGSTGGERGWKNQFGFGIPYWIWVALPEQFPRSSRGCRKMAALATAFLRAAGSRPHRRPAREHRRRAVATRLFLGRRWSQDS